MSTQRYSVTPHPIETLLTWIKSGEIAIPEIQRPFVWEATKVRNLLDSLYHGYPVGYLISWRNPTIKLKDGTPSAGKRILIDGQQRVTALMAALLGQEVLTKDYETVRIRIAFHPGEERFEVRNPAIAKDKAWIDDVTRIFDPDADLFELIEHYAERNEDADRKTVGKVLQKVGKIVNNLDRLTMILRSAGFLTSALIRSQNAVNFAYIIYLRGRAEGLPADDLERLVRRWYAMSILTGRYSGSPETAFDFDIRQIEAQGLLNYAEAVIENELADTFWTGMLPQLMATSASTSPYFIAYKAAQARLGDKGFLSTDITVRDLLLNRGDKHHVFPRKYLQGQGLSRGRYNQIANFVIAQSEINIAIADKGPETYFAEIADQVNGGPKRYGGILDREQMRENFTQNCLPASLLEGVVPDYDDFLAERRRLMALRIKTWFEVLS